MMSATFAVPKDERKIVLFLIIFLQKKHFYIKNKISLLFVTSYKLSKN